MLFFGKGEFIPKAFGTDIEVQMINTVTESVRYKFDYPELPKLRRVA